MGDSRKKNKQWEGNMEFPGVSKKEHMEFPGVNYKQTGISKGDQEKIVCNLQGLGFRP